MSTTMSELHRLATELKDKVIELTGADPDAVYLTLSVHRVGTAQVVIDKCNYFTTTQYGTEVAKWDGDPENETPPVDVMVFGNKGERLVLPPEPVGEPA